MQIKGCADVGRGTWTWDVGRCETVMLPITGNLRSIVGCIANRCGIGSPTLECLSFLYFTSPCAPSGVAGRGSTPKIVRRFPAVRRTATATAIQNLASMLGGPGSYLPPVVLAAIKRLGM